MKKFSVWFESAEFFAERKVEADSAFMAVIKASIALAADGAYAYNADLANNATTIHCAEVRE